MTTADRNEHQDPQSPQGQAPANPTCCGGKLKSVALWALVALNALLLGVLVSRHAPDSQARAAGVPPVAASELLAVPGNLPGYSNGVVFLLDSRSGMLGLISYDAPTRSLIAMPQPLDIMKLTSNPGPVRGGGGAGGGVRGK